MTIIILLLSVANVYSQSGWFWQNPLPQGNKLNDIKFFNSLTGIAIGDLATILRTTNGGENWTVVPIVETNNLNKISIVNNYAYVCGDSGILIQSSDFGSSWGALNPGVNYNINDIEFVNVNTGYFCADDFVYKSTNNGQTWNQNYHASTQLRSLNFIAQDTGFVASGSYIHRTTNAGLSWNARTYSPDNIRDIDNYDANLGIFVGDEIVISANGYDNWYRHNKPSSINSFIKIMHKDKFEWYALGNNSSFIKTTNGGGFWQTLRSPTFDEHYLNSFCLLGQNIIIAVGNAGRIIRSSDNGITWVDISKNMGFHFHGSFTSIHFPTTNIGYTIPYHSSFYTSYISKTTNSGNNWYSFSTGINKSLKSIFFVNSTTGFLATFDGYIYKSSNGGFNWELKSGYFNNFYEIVFPSANTGYAVGYSGRFVKSSNGGENWILGQFPSSNNLFCTYFISELTGYVGEATGKVFKTNNGGVNWVTQQTPVSEGIGCLYFLNENTGYGGVFSSGVSKIVKTTNGGNNWLLITLPSNFRTGFNSIFFTSFNTGYASGNNGVLVKTTNGGLNWFQNTLTTNNNLNDIYFITAETGFVVGAKETILKTVTGGQ